MSRDNNEHHITLLIKGEFKTVVEKIKQHKDYSSIVTEKCKENASDLDVLMNVLKEVIEDDWVDIGLGKIVKGEEETYFKVIEWNSAQNFLNELDIKRDFHITVGFKNKDIHGVSKDSNTLINFE
jgi:hypothetical protein